MKKHGFALTISLLVLVLPLGLQIRAAPAISPFDENSLGNEYRADSNSGISIYNAFRLNLRTVRHVRSFNFNMGLFGDSCIWDPDRERLINLLRVVEEAPAGNRVASPSDQDYGKMLSDPEQLDITFVDGSRINYIFYERAIKVTGETLEGKPLFNPGMQMVEPEIYSYFLKFIKTNYRSPAWLGSINEKRIASINIIKKDSARSRSILPEDEQFYILIDALQMTGCVPGSYRQIHKSEIIGDYTIKIAFQSGVVFTIQITPEKLEILSTNMPYLCTYKLNEFDSSILFRMLNALCESAADTEDETAQ